MEDREAINHQAYMDVLDLKDPSMTSDYYMQCYRNWLGVDSANPYWRGERP